MGSAHMQDPHIAPARQNQCVQFPQEQGELRRIAAGKLQNVFFAP